MTAPVNEPKVMFKQVLINSGPYIKVLTNALGDKLPFTQILLILLVVQICDLFNNKIMTENIRQLPGAFPKWEMMGRHYTPEQKEIIRQAGILLADALSVELAEIGLFIDGDFFPYVCNRIDADVIVLDYMPFE